VPNFYNFWDEAIMRMALIAEGAMMVALTWPRIEYSVAKFN